MEWAHSIAPYANIILLEANSPNFSDLDTAVQTAAATAGVSAVSMSYSGSEFLGENSYDSVYTTPTTRTGGVTFFAATGDNGAPSGYPAYSPNVVGVGGTTLTLNSNNNWQSETGWSGSGGGISTYEPQPAYQNGIVTQSSSARTNPDVAFDADPNSGVAVCDSYNYGTSAPWAQVGGTSLATPMWAGVMAIVNQARAISGEPSLYGGTQTLPTLYQLPQSDFHDITTGNNGNAAGPGYDLVTGRGSPIANLLVPALAGPPTGGTVSFAISTISSPTTAGTSVSFTVTAENSLNQTATGYVGTVHFTSSDPQAVLPSDYQFTTADNGMHTFNVTFDMAGTQSLAVADAITTSVLGTDTGITIVPAAASVFAVIGFTSPVTTGTSTTFTVTAKDPYNNTVTGYAGTVHFASSDGQAVLPGNYTFTSADSGVHTFSATLKTAGTQLITATDVVTSSITYSRSGITVDPAAASIFVVSGFPTPIPTDQPGSFTVTAKDAYNNTAAGYAGTVTFSSSNPLATVPGHSTLTGGIGRFSATFNTVGTQSLTATDTVTGSITGTQSGIVVISSPSGVTSFLIAGFPSTTTAGTTATITVTAENSSNQTATAYTGTVHFTSSDAQAGLPANYTFTNVDNGVHTFSVTLKTAGMESISATDTITGAITGSQSGIAVNPAAASTFVVTGFMSSATAGTSGTFTVTAEDPYNNTATDYLGTVQLTSSDGQAALPANYTFTSGDNGVHTFSATLRTSGTQSLTATDTVTGTITGSQSGISVNPAAVSTFVLTGIPSSVTAGTSGTLTVTAKDPYNNTATNYLGTVHFTSSDGQAVLPADYTFTSGDNGVHTFSATLKTAGSQSLTATDTVTGSITGSQTGITVNPAAASVFVVTGFTSPVTAGTSGTFTVTAKDPYNNTVTGYLGTVHFASSDGEAALPGNYTFTSGDNGVHTFSAMLKRAGLQSIIATDAMTDSIAGNQLGITVTAGLPTQITVTSGSGQNTSFGTGFVQPLVGWVTDSFGNGVPDVVVTFTAPTAGSGAKLASATATTGANGLVSEAVTANSIAGSYQITAAITGVAMPAAFQLTNLPATISGTVFQDVNINGVQDPREPGLAGQTVFLDLSGSGTFETGDPTATTDSNGNYQFTISSAGTYTVRQVLLGGVLLDAPANGADQVTLSSGVDVTGQNFAEVPTSIAVPLTLPLTTPFPKQGNANADFVEALYRAILDRNAEPGGLAYWTNLLNSGALSRLQVAQEIRTSPEHFTQEVTDFYFTLLDRAPDAGGLQSWVQQLENGSLTEEQVAFDFLDSPEYLSKGDKYFVDHMYLSLLGRPFDPVGEANWLNWLGDNSSGNPTHPPTLTHEQVIMDFLRSPESLNRLVQGYYQVFLQRLADPQGLSDWLAQLNAGATFLIVGQGFLSSDEYYNDAAAHG